MYTNLIVEKAHYLVFEVGFKCTDGCHKVKDETNSDYYQSVAVARGTHYRSFDLFLLSSEELDCYVKAVRRSDYSDFACEFVRRPGVKSFLNITKYEYTSVGYPLRDIEYTH